MKEIIEKGDKVDIRFTDSSVFLDCEVLYTPCATGDSWRVRDKFGKLVYIQSFESMELKDR